MKLLLIDYISLLKEDAELDNLIASIATSMDLQIVGLPQTGIAQLGVDIHAVGIDPVDNVRKNFLFTIKRGDIDRTAWHADSNGVRASLTEIIDAYIPTKISPEFSALPNKIVLCCGGTVKQQTQTLWSNYQANNQHENVQYEEWNGTKIADNVEKYLLNEYILFENVRKKIRSTLIYVSDPEYNLQHFKESIDEILFNTNLNSTLPNFPAKALKAISAVPICLALLNEYATQSGNTKHSLVAAEYTLMRSFDFILKNNLSDDNKIKSIFFKIENLFNQYGANYYNKMIDYINVKDGLVKFCGSHIEASVITFETIGFLSVLGIYQFQMGLQLEDNTAIENSEQIYLSIEKIINTLEISNTPSFDKMNIEICITLFFFMAKGKTESAKKWIESIINTFIFCYDVLGKHFPTDKNSIKELMEFEFGITKNKADMLKTSNLLPTLAYWCVLFEMDKQYEQIVSFVDKSLSGCHLQMWYPKKGIKDFILKKYAGSEFGIMEVPIVLPKTITELKNKMIELENFANQSNEIETDFKDIPAGIQLMSARHFKYQVNPLLWFHVLSKSQ